MMGAFFDTKYEVLLNIWHSIRQSLKPKNYEDYFKNFTK